MFWRLRRLNNPVNGSVWAWVSEVAKARIMAMRSDPRRDVKFNVSTSCPAGRTPSRPTAWVTPTVRPAMLTGRHAAEHAPDGRPLRYGHALSALLLGNTSA